MKGRMFFRILLRALLVRRSSSLTALIAVLVAAAVSTTMVNLYLEVQSKLRGEFRGYGANLILTSADGKALSAETTHRLDELLPGHGTAVPYSYAVARLQNGAPIVIVGTDLEMAKQQNSWWSVTTWPADGSVLLGTRAATTTSVQDGRSATLSIDYNGRPQQLAIGGLLRTGGPEDSRVYIPWQTFTPWTGLGANTIEIAANGGEQEILLFASQLRASLPGVKVEPVHRILAAEANVFGKTRKALFSAVLIIIATAILCVLATLTSSVLDRRRDFALMKALGASQRTTNLIFAAEASALGIAGSLGGFLIGIGLAAWIGRVNFHAAVAPRFDLLPAILAGGVLLTLLASVLPISLLRSAQPAVLLKGE